MFASLADKMNPWNKLKSYCCAAVSIMARKKRMPNFEQFTILEETTDDTNYHHYIVPRSRDIVRHTEYVSAGNKVSARMSFYTASTTDAGDKDAPSFDLSELCGPTSTSGYLLSLALSLNIIYYLLWLRAPQGVV